MLLPYLTFSTGIREIEDILHVEFTYTHGSVNPMVPGTKVPVINCDADHKIIALRWGMSYNMDKTAIPWVRAEGIINRTGVRVPIRTHRCVALSNCFFIRNNEAVYLFYLPGEKILTFAGVWEKKVRPDKSVDTSFSILTRDAPEALKKITKRVPLIIARSLIRKYLNLKSPLMDITGILNSTRYPGVNAYPLRADLLSKSEWTRQDLVPAGELIFPRREPGEKLLLHNRYYR